MVLIPSAAEIDKTVKLGLNHPMGPFEMVDLIGLEVRPKILEYFASDPRRKIPAESTAEKICAEGRLGRKAGRGVYDCAPIDRTRNQLRSTGI